jgi:hypothetical protein
VYYTSVREFSENVSNTTNNGYTDHTFSFEPDISVTTPISFQRDIEPWKRGLLLSKLVYKSDNTLLQSTINTYEAYKYDTTTNLAKVRFINQSNATCVSCNTLMNYNYNGHFLPIPSITLFYGY